MGMALFLCRPFERIPVGTEVFPGLTEDDLVFSPFPATNDKVNYPTIRWVLPPVCRSTLSLLIRIECAEILDKIMTNEFMVKLTKEWPDTGQFH